MGLVVVLCAVAGHRWRIDETSTGPEAMLCCSRCGRRQPPSGGSGFDNRVAAKTGADRAVGPFGNRR